jgi:hypothetical protein
VLVLRRAEAEASPPSFESLHAPTTALAASAARNCRLLST